MRLYVLIDRYPPILGGAQNNVHEMGQRFVAMGHQVTVLTRRLYRHLPTRERVDGVQVRRLGYARFRILSKLVCSVSILIMLVRERHVHDLVLAVPCVESTDLLPAHLASLLTRVPFVIRSTGLPTFLDPPPGEIGIALRNLALPRRLWDRVLERAEAYVTQSSVLTEGISRHTSTRCVMIPNGVDRTRFRPAAPAERLELRRTLGLPDDRILLVNTGRYDQEKNQITLLRAVQRLERELRPGRTYTVVLGATQRNQVTSNEAQLKTYAEAEGLGEVVRFIDDATNVEDYLRAADVFIHPTTGEGMSNALLEAMGVGLPIVCSNIPQETCMFEDAEGYFFPPEDDTALLELLLPLIDSASLRGTAGAAMDRLARERYENDRLVLQYVELFEEITSARGGPAAPS